MILLMCDLDPSFLHIASDGIEALI